MADEHSRFKETMRAMVAGMNDPANRAPCVDCEKAGYLLTVSGRKIDCPFCYGSGSVLIRNPFAEIGGAAIWGRVATEGCAGMNLNQ